MQLKKGWFGYINFSIGTILMSVYLYTLFVSLYESYEVNVGCKVFFFNIPLSYILSAAVLIVTVGFFFLFNFIKSKIIKTDKPGLDKFNTCLYYVFSLLAFIGSVLVRIIDIRKTEGLGLQTAVFNIKISALLNGNSLSFDNFVSKIYSYVVLFFVKVFGNSYYVYAIVNASLFVIGALLLYMGLRYLCGDIPALFAYCFVIFLGKSTDLTYDYSGFTLWFFFVGFIVFLLGYFLELAFAKYPVTSFLTVLAVVCFLVALNDLLFNSFEIVFVPDESYLLYSVSDLFQVTCIVIIFALFGYLSFLKESSDELSLVNIVTILIAFFSLFDYSNNQNFIYMILCFGLLSGRGFYWLFFEGFKDRVITEAIEVTEVTEVSEVSEEKTEAVKDEASNVKPEDVEVIEIPKVKLLDNPLPLPKKHVKKNLEFSIEPKEEDFKFDIDIKDDDDFDIK